jgi:serine/threonine-protein kinase
MPKGYWVPIPEGEFQMGSENGNDDEKPVRAVNVNAFKMGLYEVTNRQYFQCVNAGICSALNNSIYTVQEQELHPVTNVNWRDANTYCGWVGGRLPTEAEWEKAARGTDERTYPWGEDISCDRANYYGCAIDNTTLGIDNTMPVGSYENGQSPYGVYDMAGNVWEWTSSLYQPYPYDANDGREDMNSPDGRVLRGGSWDPDDSSVRSAYRDWSVPSNTLNYVGFRCARDVP